MAQRSDLTPSASPTHSGCIHISYLLPLSLSSAIHILQDHLALGMSRSFQQSWSL